ncbi:MAG: hypothetical protein Fur0020_07830 [Thermodesulfovibrionia bacterium]
MCAIIGSSLRKLGRFKIDDQKTPHEIWRSIRVSPAGDVYQLVIDNNRVYIKRFVLRDFPSLRELFPK